ncbi:MAG: Gfo/Idh/MocA family protein [Rhodothermales bacterium]
MNVGIIGAGRHAGARRRAVEVLPDVTLKGVLHPLPEAATLPAVDPGAAVATPYDPLLEKVDAIFVTVPTAEHFRIAEAATKRGVHVFLEWPPATSVRECQAIIGLSEEAGVEVGVSRPLRFHTVFEALPEPWRASLLVLHWEVPDDQDVAWPRWLADAVDLCCALAQSSSVQRIDAEAVRRGAWPEAVAFGLRFHSGTYAQISIRRKAGPMVRSLYAAGAGFEVDLDLAETAGSLGGIDRNGKPSPITAETKAFLQAIAGQHPVPVSILDGLHTMRLVERLMEKLR